MINKLHKRLTDIDDSRRSEELEHKQSQRELESIPFEEVRYFKIKNTVSPLWMNKDNLQICIDNTCTNGGAEVLEDVTHRNKGFIGGLHGDSFSLGMLTGLLMVIGAKLLMMYL